MTVKNSNKEQKWLFVDKKGKAKMHSTEWCAAANKYRCMRCARSSECVKMPRTCRDMWGPKVESEGPQPQVEKVKQSASGRHDMVRRVWCRKCSGDAKLMHRCRPEQMGTQEHGNMFKIIFMLVKERSLTGMLKDGMSREKMEESQVKRARDQGNHLESEISWRRKRCGTSPKRGFWKTEDPCLKRRVISSQIRRPCTRSTSQ